MLKETGSPTSQSRSPNFNAAKNAESSRAADGDGDAADSNGFKELAQLLGTIKAPAKASEGRRGDAANLAFAEHALDSLRVGRTSFAVGGARADDDDGAVVVVPPRPQYEAASRDRWDGHLRGHDAGAGGPRKSLLFSDS